MSPGARRALPIDTKTLKCSGRVIWIVTISAVLAPPPILWNNLLINNHDGADVQYVFALDKETGKTV